MKRVENFQNEKKKIQKTFCKKKSFLKQKKMKKRFAKIDRLSNEKNEQIRVLCVRVTNFER